jgi:hypothetical protein
MVNVKYKAINIMHEFCKCGEKISKEALAVQADELELLCNGCLKWLDYQDNDLLGGE